ncbi:hypothetical protein D3C76_1883380 [compost metagenome]
MLVGYVDDALRIGWVELQVVGSQDNQLLTLQLLLNFFCRQRVLTQFDHLIFDV